MIEPGQSERGATEAPGFRDEPYPSVAPMPPIIRRAALALLGEACAAVRLLNPGNGPESLQDRRVLTRTPGDPVTAVRREQ